MSDTRYYKLVLTGFPDHRRLPAIAGLREIFDYTLVGSKRATETVPHLLASGLSLEDAERLAAEMAQNSAMTEILPDETAAEPNTDFREVVCPKCGFAGLKIIPPFDKDFLRLTPTGTVKHSHLCQACRERFLED